MERQWTEPGFEVRQEGKGQASPPGRSDVEEEEE